MAKELAEGVKAPAFSLPLDDGRTLKLKDFAGRKLVLYFYPKDDTPGCTKEAEAFSGAQKKFEKAGAAVLGVSRDTVAKHKKFKEKHGLKIDLGADETGKVTEDYGVWGEKVLYGRKYMGIERATFLIDEKGVIRRVWRKVRVPGHAEEVLEAVKAL
ncbi:MAG: thioredoxin-dependent thiol peroxidase [Parvularculaceae bacterium]